MPNFANSTVDYENCYCFISIKFDVEKKWNNYFQKFHSRRNETFVGILIFLVFFKSCISYLWQAEISFCKVLVPIVKAVPVKNDYFLHSKFEFHRYQ